MNCLQGLSTLGKGQDAKEIGLAIESLNIAHHSHSDRLYNVVHSNFPSTIPVGRLF